MLERRALTITAGSILLALLSACQQSQPTQPTQAAQKAQQAPSSELAAVRLNELGPENEAMARSVGQWDVTETVWDTPGAAPQVIKGLVAERRMVGQMLQETLRSASDPNKILRMDYLSFNRVERRWEYVSLEMRAPVGIMTAQSYGRDKDENIEIVFQPFAIAGPGRNATGQMLRMRQQFIAEGPDSQRKDQYFTLADGVNDEWLAHQYLYARR
jgi:hypothetical protein